MKKAILLSFCFLLVLPLRGQAIGQITEPIVITDALRGQEIVSTLTLLNSEKKQNIIGLVADGQIADWTFFYNKDDKDFKNAIKEIEVPAGEYLDVLALFKIPADIANGEYTGEIAVVYSPIQASSTDETSSSVAQKIGREVKITVSDKENIALNVSVIPEKFDYKPGEALKVRIIYDNQSNIILSPSVQFKITKNEQSVYNVIYPYPDNEPAVRSMDMHEIPAITIATQTFGEGNFLAELNFLKGDKTILNKNFSFSIGVSKSAAAGILDFAKKNLNYILWAIVIVLIVTAVFLLIKFREKNENDKKPKNNKNNKKIIN